MPEPSPASNGCFAVLDQREKMKKKREYTGRAYVWLQYCYGVSLYISLTKTQMEFHNF